MVTTAVTIGVTTGVGPADLTIRIIGVTATGDITVAATAHMATMADIRMGGRAIIEVILLAIPGHTTVTIREEVDQVTMVRIEAGTGTGLAMNGQGMTDQETADKVDPATASGLYKTALIAVAIVDQITALALGKTGVATTAVIAVATRARVAMV